MRYEIVLAPKAVEDLQQLEVYRRATVRDALETHLRHEPTKTSKNRIKRLRGVRRPQYRMRVGELRGFYDVVDGSVEVLAIVEKEEVNEWLERAGKER